MRKAWTIYLVLVVAVFFATALKSFAYANLSSLARTDNNTIGQDIHRAAAKFDGHRLYRAAFEAVRDYHLQLADPCVREKWCRQWEHRYDSDKTLETPEGADKAVLDMIHSLGKRFDYYLSESQTDKEKNDEIGTQPVARFNDFGDGVGYIKLDDFDSQNCVEDMKQALSKARGSKVLILDLRFNRGGWVRNAVHMSQFFLPEGTILVRRDREGNTISELAFLLTREYGLRREGTVGRPKTFSVKRFERAPLAIADHVPMVVLVNDYTASSAEILAMVLQHDRRAVLVGVPTWGKGEGQTPVDLPYGRRLHVTSFEFFPAGLHINSKGITPDIFQAQPEANADDIQLDVARKVASGLLAREKHKQ